MSTDWSDERLNAALAGLAGRLRTPDPAVLRLGPPAGRTVGGPNRRPGARWLAVAAALVVAVAVVAVWPDARRTVSGWFGLGALTVHVEDVELTPLPRFVDGVRPVAVDDAVAELGAIAAAFERAGLGRPDRAGRPPEGGLVVAWRAGDVSLWTLPADGPALVQKNVGSSDHLQVVEDLGTDVAILVDGDHVMMTAVRAVAADQVIWWFEGDVQHRLEADLPAERLVEMARALSAGA